MDISATRPMPTPRFSARFPSAIFLRWRFFLTRIQLGMATAPRFQPRQARVFFEA